MSLNSFSNWAQIRPTYPKISASSQTSATGLGTGDDITEFKRNKKWKDLFILQPDEHLQTNDQMINLIPKIEDIGQGQVLLSIVQQYIFIFMIVQLLGFLGTPGDR